MRIVYHLGAHCTDDERLLRCLLKNRAALSAEGIVVPGPARYRTLLRETAMQLRGQPASRDTQTMLLDQIMSEDRAERLILAWDSFLGYAQGAVGASLYPLAGRRVAAFSQIFPDIEAELFLAIRNPATMVPTLYRRLEARGVMLSPEGIDPFALRWSDVVARLREAVPDATLTIWCDEDTPLLWPEVLRAVSGHSASLTLQDTDELLASIMRPEGVERMQAYTAANPPTDDLQRRRIASVFLARYARPEAIEQDIDMPGWDAATVARLTEAYDRDVGRLMRMDGVRMLSPS
jgi:hypothetical protein